MTVVLRTELSRHLPCLLSPTLDPGPQDPDLSKQIWNWEVQKEERRLSLGGLLCIRDDTPTVLRWKTTSPAICTGGKEKKKKPNLSSLSLLGFRVIAAFTFLL